MQLSPTTENIEFEPIIACRQHFVAHIEPAVLRVIVLDHHKTAIEMLTPSEAHCPNLDLQLDINRSGATIALDYFKPQVHTSIVLFAPHTVQPVAAT